MCLDFLLPLRGNKSNMSEEGISRRGHFWCSLQHRRSLAKPGSGNPLRTNFHPESCTVFQIDFTLGGCETTPRVLQKPPWSRCFLEQDCSPFQRPLHHLAYRGVWSAAWIHRLREWKRLHSQPLLQPFPTGVTSRPDEACLDPRSFLHPCVRG